MGRFKINPVKAYKRKLIRTLTKYRNRNYYKSLDSLIDNMIKEDAQRLQSQRVVKESNLLDINNQHSQDPLNSNKKIDSQGDSNFDSIEDQQSTSADNNPPQNFHLEITERETNDIDEWIEEFQGEIDVKNKIQANKDNSNENISQRKIGDNSDQYIEYTAIQEELKDLDHNKIERLKEHYLKVAYENGSSLIGKIIKPVDRRKNIDPKATVKKGIARNGGNFSRFYYKKSPTIITSPIKPLDLLIIGDVSGSMGKYVVIVLYLISALDKIANINSYIFSDTPTYATPFIDGSTFEEQYKILKENATSWEYGTRLSLALKEVIKEKKFKSSTIVLLITDGGISLEGNDPQDTITGLSTIKGEVDRVLLLSPNEALINEGKELSLELWKLNSELGKTKFSVPFYQKLFRYGVLSKYTDKQLICSNIQDIDKIIEELIECS